MSHHSLRARLRYKFDNTMSRGTPAMIAWLGVVSVIMILFVAVVVWALGFAPDGPSFFELSWMSLMRTLDPGTMGGDEGPWAFRFAMLAITLGGIFVISTLIGVLTTGIEAQIEALRKGRSRVVEADHTVILGWSEAIFSIVSELSIANESRKGKGACVVVLAAKDKVEMEDEIRARCQIRKGTRVVCRTGQPTEFADLEITSLHEARSIIALAPEQESPDPEVVKVLLAIVNNPGRRAEPYHIVAEIQSPENVEVAMTIGRGEVTILQTADLVSRIVAQTCLLSGLSVVYSELLSYDGDEMYFFSDPKLVGKTFADVVRAFETSSVVGVAPHDGPARLNPPMDSVIREGDQLVVISEDDDTIVLSGKSDFPVDRAAFAEAGDVEKHPQDILILNWNRRAATMVVQLDTYLPKGSTIQVVARSEEVATEIDSACCVLANAVVRFQTGDTIRRDTLKALGVENYAHVIVLSDESGGENSDTGTLFTLLHLRDLAAEHGANWSIVSEVMDVRNLRLAQATRADDFVVSNRLVSMLMTQISENKGIKDVYDDILDADGSELYLKPVERYVKTGVPVTFYTVVESAIRYSEVAFGYRIASQAHDAEHHFGVKLNPDKSQTFTFAPGDKIIVAAED